MKNEEYDYGFSVVDEDLVSADKHNEQIEDLKDRLKEVKEIILPFLNKLMENSDKPMINWPNRKPIIQKQIDKILSLTEI